MNSNYNNRQYPNQGNNYPNSQNNPYTQYPRGYPPQNIGYGNNFPPVNNFPNSQQGNNPPGYSFPPQQPPGSPERLWEVIAAGRARL